MAPSPGSPNSSLAPVRGRAFHAEIQRSICLQCSPVGVAPGKQVSVSQLIVSIALKEKCCLLAAPILAACSLKEKHTESDKQPWQAGISTQGWHGDRQCQNVHTPASPHSSAASSPVTSSAATAQGWADWGMKTLPLSCLCPAAQRPNDRWNFILGTQNSLPSRMKLFS